MSFRYSLAGRVDGDWPPVMTIRVPSGRAITIESTPSGFLSIENIGSDCIKVTPNPSAKTFFAYMRISECDAITPARQISFAGKRSSVLATSYSIMLNAGRICPIAAGLQNRNPRLHIAVTTAAAFNSLL